MPTAVFDATFLHSTRAGSDKTYLVVLAGSSHAPAGDTVWIFWGRRGGGFQYRCVATGGGGASAALDLFRTKVREKSDEGYSRVSAERGLLHRSWTRTSHPTACEVVALAQARLEATQAPTIQHILDAPMSRSARGRINDLVMDNARTMIERAPATRGTPGAAPDLATELGRREPTRASTPAPTSDAKRRARLETPRMVDALDCDDLYVL